jgi:tetratricopeptide (TPR) repeat protein
LRDELDAACREDYLPGMRPFWPALLILAVAGPALAEENLLAPGGGGGRAAPAPERAVRSALPVAPKAELDDLFGKLADAKSEREAHPFEQRILARWNQSGSATVDLLMGWADEAIAARKLGRALDVLDQVILLKPDFAEGYNRRATVYYLQDDYRNSIRDIEATLRLEPRHFGAMSGLGTILAEIGDTRRAEEIYRKALALHPNLAQVRKQLDELETRDKGSPI